MAARKEKDALARALATARRQLFNVALFSSAINVLMLAAPLYMLQIYDRVLASRSVDTLLYLTLVTVGALLLMGLLDLVRSRLLVRVGARFDRDLAGTVFAGVLLGGKSGQPLRDLDVLRGFFTGPSLLSLLDAPWLPLYLAVVYLLHPWLGHLALAGALVLLILGILNELLTRRILLESGAELAAAGQFAETSARNAAVVHAMGMLPGLAAVWRARHTAGIGYQAQASDRAALIASSAKFVRFALQSGILGVGAYLAIRQVISPGAMIAASIVAARALAPVEGAINGWRGLVQARGAHQRLRELVLERGDDPEFMPLPAPRGSLRFDNVYAVAPGGEKPVVAGATFRLEAGESLGITGPSAAGKSSLARLMVGVWRPSSGHVRLDGADVGRWDRQLLGPHIGYLPQEIELFPGSISANIARFGNVDPAAVVEAAKLAGAHEIILKLPHGYDTPIGPGGQNLSGGQRQRVALARAFYGEPALVVLDEPTSNLDTEGEAAVRQALSSLRERGRTVVIIAHRPAVVGEVDKILVIRKGVVTHFGPTAEVLPQITRKVVTRLKGPTEGAATVPPRRS
jgi:PrtD family type I secretion system ABC transporter